MAHEMKRTCGKRLARKVCSEIVRCGLDNVLTARYEPAQRTIRIGVPTPYGTLDCAIDYPADPEQVEGLLDRFHAYVMAHQTQLRTAFRAGSHARKAA